VNKKVDEIFINLSRTFIRPLIHRKYIRNDNKCDFIPFPLLTKNTSDKERTNLKENLAGALEKYNMLVNLFILLRLLAFDLLLTRTRKQWNKIKRFFSSSQVPMRWKWKDLLLPYFLVPYYSISLYFSSNNEIYCHRNLQRVIKRISWNERHNAIFRLTHCQ
jgi:hypothetical protein